MSCRGLFRVADTDFLIISLSYKSFKWIFPQSGTQTVWASISGRAVWTAKTHYNQIWHMKLDKKKKTLLFVSVIRISPEL